MVCNNNKFKAILAALGPNAFIEQIVCYMRHQKSSKKGLRGGELRRMHIDNSTVVLNFPRCIMGKNCVEASGDVAEAGVCFTQAIFL